MEEKNKTRYGVIEKDNIFIVIDTKENLELLKTNSFNKAEMISNRLENGDEHLKESLLDKRRIEEKNSIINNIKIDKEQIENNSSSEEEEDER